MELDGELVGIRGQTRQSVSSGIISTGGISGRENKIRTASLEREYAQQMHNVRRLGGTRVDDTDHRHIVT